MAGHANQLSDPAVTKPAAPGRRRARPEAQTLLGFRLPLLASIRSTTSARRYERLFGLKSLEGRTLYVLGANQALSLKQLVRVAGIEKAYASRTIAALVEAGLVTKETDETDRRAIRLTLTPAGRTVYEAVLRDSIARDEDWMSVLTPAECTVLFDFLDRLTERARALAEAERREHQDTPRPTLGR
jgi:DNA-binding MarR family transcriptional regulator